MSLSRLVKIRSNEKNELTIIDLVARKKQEFKDDENPIFDEACLYKRGEYWQFRMWFSKGKKYARKSLRTLSITMAVERGKAAYLEIYANL